MMNIPIKLLSSNAKVPVRADSGAAGYDLYAAHGAIIQGGDRALIQTDIAIAIPRGWYGRIAPRSGLALKHGIAVLGGVCDSSYRGPVACILINHGRSAVTILRDERIAQLIIERCAAPEWQVVEDLDETTRGGGGFGSTDTKTCTNASGLRATVRAMPCQDVNAGYPIQGDFATEVPFQFTRRALTATEIKCGHSAPEPFNPLDHEQTK